MSFIRCDRGSVPADHHTLAMALGPVGRYVHSAYQVGDLDALAAGEEPARAGVLPLVGYRPPHPGQPDLRLLARSGRFLVEHFTDGDMFDNTLEPGWAPMAASGLAQWGPPPSKDFLGVGTPRRNGDRTFLNAKCLAPQGQ